MGRHSAPDDERESPPAPATATLDAAAGRHHSAAEEADQEADRAADQEADGDSRPAPRAESGTHGDLRLLRERPALRARCAAAVIVPFLLYTAVLVLLGRADVYLVWAWIPTVSAGIAVGAFLDIAHRRER